MRKKSGASQDVHLKIEIKNKAKENVYIIEKKEILYLPYLAYDRKTR